MTNVLPAAPRICLVGPYRSTTITGLGHNIARGRRAAAALVALGYPVHCPWLDWDLLTVDGPRPSVANLQRNSLAWLGCSQLVLTVGPWWESEGARTEIVLALSEWLIPVRSLRIHGCEAHQVCLLCGRTSRLWPFDSSLYADPTEQCPCTEGTNELRPILARVEDAFANHARLSAPSVQSHKHEGDNL